MSPAAATSPMSHMSHGYSVPSPMCSNGPVSSPMGAVGPISSPMGMHYGPVPSPIVPAPCAPVASPMGAVGPIGSPMAIQTHTENSPTLTTLSPALNTTNLMLQVILSLFVLNYFY